MTRVLTSDRQIGDPTEAFANRAVRRVLGVGLRLVMEQDYTLRRNLLSAKAFRSRENERAT